MKDKPYTVEQEQIARFAKAMGHPARMAILAFLANQESCFFGDIHEVLPIAKATVSQHLKELKEAGLIHKIPVPCKPFSYLFSLYLPAPILRPPWTPASPA